MDTITLPAEPAERSFPISWLFSVSPEANEHPCERIARKKPGASMVALIALGAALDGGVGRGEATISEALLGVGNRWKWRRIYGGASRSPQGRPDLRRNAAWSWRRFRRETAQSGSAGGVCGCARFRRRPTRRGNRSERRLPECKSRERPSETFFVHRPRAELQRNPAGKLKIRRGAIGSP